MAADEVQLFIAEVKHDWQLLNTEASPEPRMGHSCLCTSHGLVLYGGAVPTGPLNDVHLLKDGAWTAVTTAGETPPARYDHTAVLASDGVRMVVFGGSAMDGLLNDVWVLCLDSMRWTSVACSGDVPCPRTLHASCLVGNCMWLCGGALLGNAPVEDFSLYSLDLETFVWSQCEVEGRPPSPRFGHTLTVSPMGSDGKTEVMLFGGMDTQRVYNELYSLELSTAKREWQRVEVAGDTPVGRTGHAAASATGPGDVLRRMVVFGGMSPFAQACYHDAWSFDFDNRSWAPCEATGEAPVARLDCTLVNLSTSDALPPSDDTPELLLFGGTDFQGMYGDTWKLSAG